MSTNIVDELEWRGLINQSTDLEALRAVLEPFGIREIVQSGLLAISRGSRSISDRSTWA